MGELYSSTACWKARSFRLAVLVSVVALVVTVLVVVGLATGLAGESVCSKWCLSVVLHLCSDLLGWLMLFN